MTMVPSQTLSKHHHQLYCGGGYGGSFIKEEYYETTARLLVQSDLVFVSAAHNPMAENESRTTTTTTNTTTSASLNNNKEEEEEAAASSSKDVGAEEQEDASWLQLSIGCGGGASAPPPASRGGVGLVELDLLPTSRSEDKRVISEKNASVPQRHVPSFLFQATAAGSGSSTIIPPPPPPLSLPHHLHHYHQENINNWAFRPTMLSLGTNSNSLSSNYPSTFMQLGSYLSRTPFQFHGGGGGNIAGPSLNFRVIDPPRIPHSGIWFSLQASQNQ